MTVRAALIPGLCIAYAVALQFQLTLFASGTYLGLRLNMADLLTPFALVAAIFSIRARHTLRPRWAMPNIPFWLAAITALLSLAMLNGILIYATISDWALANKLGGWAVIVALFMVGSWLGTNMNERQARSLFSTLLAVFLSVLIYQLGYRISQVYDLDLYIPTWMPMVQYQYLPIDGSMANRNAYALLFLTITAFAGQSYLSRNGLIADRMCELLFLLLPCFMIFNGSRAMGLGLIAVLLALFIANRASARRSGRLMIMIFIGIVVMAGMLWNKPREVILLRSDPVEFITKAKSLKDAGELAYPGDSIRMTVLRDALEQVQQRPLLGSGLGGAMMYQIQKHGSAVNVIDSTPLWLFVETGIVGLLVFSAFYLTVVRTLWTRIRQETGWRATLAPSMLLTILGFTISCLFHEIMYTRHIWFLLGLALALPKTHPGEPPPASPRDR